MERVGKEKLVKRLAKEVGVNQEKAKALVDAFLATVLQEVKKGNVVILRGFGTFKSVVRKGGKRRNPKTGATIEVPTKVFFKFVPSENSRVLKVIK